MPRCDALTSIDLRNNLCGVAGAAALARCLPHTALRSLSVADNVLLGRYLSDKEHGFVGGDGTPADCTGLTSLLRAATQLRSLDLSFNFLGNEGAAALADVFRASHDAYAGLSLALGFNKFTPADVGCLCAALRRPLGGGLALRALCLRNNTLRAAGATSIALALAPQDGCALAVAELSLMNNHLGPDGGHAVALAARRNPWLLLLDVTGNLLGPSGVTALADALYGTTSDAHVPCLEVLLLHRNNAGDDGALAISWALTSPTSMHLHTLLLSNCHIHSAGAAALAAALAVNTSLEHMNLQRNHFTADDEVQLKLACAPGRTLLLGHGPV